MTSEARPRLVVDASAAVAIIRGEQAGTLVRQEVRAWASMGGRFLVPDAFWLELANVLVRRYAVAPDEIVEAIREIDELGVESVRLDRSLLLLAIDLQARHGLSAYDAAYLAVAQAEDGRLLTLDVRLARAAGDRALPLDGSRPTRLSEEPAIYAGEPVDWARFGPYLARLRAEARDLVPQGAVDR